MVTKTYRRPIALCCWWASLRTWQRLVVGGILLADLLLGAALAYVQPGAHIVARTGTALGAPTMKPMPALPPGTDMYYYWGQWKPLDQQP